MIATRMTRTATILMTPMKKRETLRIRSPPLAKRALEAALRRNLSIKGIQSLSRVLKRRRKSLQIKRSRVVVTLILPNSKDYLLVGPLKIPSTTPTTATSPATAVITALNPPREATLPPLRAKKKGNNL